MCDGGVGVIVGKEGGECEWKASGAALGQRGGSA